MTPRSLPLTGASWSARVARSSWSTPPANGSSMSRGDSVYAGPEDGALTIVGTGEVAQAYQPTSETVVGELIDLVPTYSLERELKQDRRGRGPSER